MIKAGELLNLISEETLQFFATESNVNNQVKKLDGIVMFKLILFSMLNSEKASLRLPLPFLFPSSGCTCLII